MQDARTQSDRERIEELIHQVRGVLSAYVSITQEGEVEEVHVLGDAERTPKQIVRDIEFYRHNYRSDNPTSTASYIFIGELKLIQSFILFKKKRGR